MKFQQSPTPDDRAEDDRNTCIENSFPPGRPNWTGPPEEPIPYAARDRRADLKAGRADGRRGLLKARLKDAAKLLERDEQAVLPTIETPHLAMLAYWSADLIQAEWIRCEDDCHSLGIQLAEAENAVHELRLRSEITAENVERARERAMAPPKPDDLHRRLPVEADAATHPDELIVRRRRTALANAVQRAEEAHVEIQARLNEEMRRSVLLRELTVRRERVARARALRVHQHFQLRRAVYLGRLVRKHANHSLLNSLLELSTPQLPSWVRDEPRTDEEIAT